MNIQSAIIEGARILKDQSILGNGHVFFAGIIKVKLFIILNIIIHYKYI